MELSIVMPAYNEEATILNAVQSAIDAKLPIGEWEVIVVENGSQDRTRELLRSAAVAAQGPDHRARRQPGQGRCRAGGCRRRRGPVHGRARRRPGVRPQRLRQHAPATCSTAAWTPPSAPGTGSRTPPTATGTSRATGVINVMANMLYNVYLSDCMVGMKMVSVDDFKALQLRRTGSGSTPSSWPGSCAGGPASTRCPSPTTPGAAPRARSSPAKDGLVMLRVFVQNRFARVT